MFFSLLSRYSCIWWRYRNAGITKWSITVLTIKSLTTNTPQSIIVVKIINRYQTSWERKNSLACEMFSFILHLRRLREQTCWILNNLMTLKKVYLLFCEHLRVTALLRSLINKSITCYPRYNNSLDLPEHFIFRGQTYIYFLYRWFLYSRAMVFA